MLHLLRSAAWANGCDHHNNNATTGGEGRMGGRRRSAYINIDGCAMMRRMAELHLSLSVLVIVAIDRHAVGGGAELLTCADLAVLRHTASVNFVHAQRGTSTGWGGDEAVGW
jgi:enoyl-CoA hydratase/carnithine racemase